MYDPSIAPMLDWVAVFCYIGAATFVTWQVMTRSQKRD